MRRGSTTLRPAASATIRVSCARNPSTPHAAAAAANFRNPLRAARMGKPGEAGLCSFLPGVREEQPLAADLVVGNRLLPFRRDDPVDEGLPHLLLDVPVPVRIHQDDAVLVEQPLVAFDEDRELASVLEREPGG